MAGQNESTFTNLNPETLPPELQETYKLMQADYTRKRQEDSNSRKQAEEARLAMEKKLEEIQTRTAELEAYARTAEQTNLQWQEWYKQNAARLEDRSGENHEAGVEDSRHGAAGVTGAEGELDPRIVKMIEESGGAAQATIGRLTAKIQELEKKQQFALQLSELARTRGNEVEGFDPGLIVNKALELGTEDLNQAFEKAYEDPLFEKKVQARLAKEKETWENSRKTNVLAQASPPVVQSTFFTPDLSVPKSYEECTRLALEEDALAASE